MIMQPPASHRPPRLQPFQGTSNAASTKKSPFIANLADNYKRTIQNEVDVEFNDYALYDYNESLPTPSSGASTGLDLFIVVTVNTLVTTSEFQGLAKYMHLTLYYNSSTGVSHLKEVTFSHS